MTTKMKGMLRAGVKIREHLQGPARQLPLGVLPQAAWDQLCKFVERLQYVQTRGWQVAGQTVLGDVEYTVYRLQRELESFTKELEGRSPQQVASASEIAADLAALEKEFEAVEVCLKERQISVLTEPIELKGVYLGPFRIVLTWSRIGLSQAYELVAEEPNCPPDHDDVTHPHVRDGQLCEGDGAAPIRAALKSGRFLDFFVLLRQILQTYNSASPHVGLCDWEGLSCKDCGSSMSRDDYSTCERCDEHVCSDCWDSCDACSRSVCSKCANICAECDNRFCTTCLTEEKGTDRLLCDTCLAALPKKDQAHECPDQVQVQPASPTEAAPDSTAPAADALCVVEAAVPPRPRRNGGGRVRSQQPRRPAARRRRTSRTATVHAGNGEV